MKRRRILRSLIVVGLVGTCAATGTFAAFSASTSSAGNSFSAGTVAIADNDAGSALLSLPAAAPGQSTTSCITVTYSGSLDAGVRLYTTLSGGLAPYLNLVVTRGTDPSPVFSSCSGFNADGTNYIGQGAGVIYSGTLAAFPATYAAGLVDPLTGAPETWTAGEKHSYRFAVTLAANDAAQGLSQTAAFTWEARNL